MVQLLWIQRAKLHVYLDDWLIHTVSPVQTRTHAHLVLCELQHLGWVINLSTSALSPGQKLDFISMQFNTCAYMVAPLPKMRVKIQNILDHWRFHPSVIARDLHILQGMLAFMVTLMLRSQFTSAQSSGGHHRFGARRQGPGLTGFHWPQTFPIKWLGGPPLQCWRGSHWLS